MRSILIVLVLLLGGCAVQNAYWLRPNGVSEAQFYGDRLQCEQAAVNMYPNMAPSNAGNVASQTNCFAYGGQINCTTIPAQGNAGFQDTLNKLKNDQNRQNVISNCLNSRGYRWTTGHG